MKSNRAHLPQTPPGALPHFQMRFRPIQAQPDEREDLEKGPAEQPREDETLIPDPRGRLRPAEHVERKLIGLLGQALMPVSFYRVTASSD